MSRALAEQHVRDLHRGAAASERLDAPPSPVGQHWAVLALRLHLGRARAAATTPAPPPPAPPSPPRPGAPAGSWPPHGHPDHAVRVGPGAAADGLHRVTPATG